MSGPITLDYDSQHGIKFTYVMGVRGCGKSTWISHKLKNDMARGIKSIGTEFDSASAKLGVSIAAMKGMGITQCYVEIPSHSSPALSAAPQSQAIARGGANAPDEGPQP